VQQALPSDGATRSREDARRETLKT
jgi:hypothetical protein